MSFGIFPGKQHTPDTFVYYVSYGESYQKDPEFFTPNLIKANIRDALGEGIKVKLSKHYRARLREGKSFPVTVVFSNTKQK